MKKNVSTILAAVGLLCLAAYFILMILPACDRRECYFEHETEFQDRAYDEPQDLVDRFFSNPDRHGQREEVRIKETDAGVTVIIELYMVADDSIQDVRYRFDLVEVDGKWGIEWSGTQQTCGRGAIGPQKWHNHYCN